MLFLGDLCPKAQLPSFGVSPKVLLPPAKQSGPCGRMKCGGYDCEAEGLFCSLRNSSWRQRYPDRQDAPDWQGLPALHRSHPRRTPLVGMCSLWEGAGSS